MPAKKSKAPVKKTVAKRTVNKPNRDMGQQLNSGAPFNDQDIKRRAGRFEGAGEFTRGGTRGK